MVHIFKLSLWNVFCLSKKSKANVVESKTKKPQHNNDNNQRLLWVFVDTTEIHAAQTEPICTGLHRFSTHVLGNQFWARQG